MLSASVENFCSSPWAFWMSACSPAACIACVSSGLSKPSQRAELAVSGRITPTLAPLAAAGAARASAARARGGGVLAAGGEREGEAEPRGRERGPR